QQLVDPPLRKTAWIAEAKAARDSREEIAERPGLLRQPDREVDLGAVDRVPVELGFVQGEFGLEQCGVAVARVEGRPSCGHIGVRLPLAGDPEQLEVRLDL